ncbi:MAG: helix-turn-helix transcriptional regulator [Muribaculaceae bacterium]|nr:helix-turn-helix transcriptional regulator [Muribaculaceae bacterium]
MAKNNQFTRLDTLLLSEVGTTNDAVLEQTVRHYAESMAMIEGVIAVVSNLGDRTSKIYMGSFANVLGLQNYSDENSIWEKRILERMSADEFDAKMIAELRFYHRVKSSAKLTGNSHMMMKLRIRNQHGLPIEVLHRMYYVCNNDRSRVLYAICVYGPLVTDFNGKAVLVDNNTGSVEELTSATDRNILTPREKQVLALIDTGLKSADIAHQLHISKHTVSRHRQNILEKLQVRNSVEACRLAKQMSLL